MSLISDFETWQHTRRQAQAVTNLCAGLGIAPDSPWRRVLGGMIGSRSPAETRVRDLASLAALASDTARYARAAGAEQQAEALDALSLRLIAFATTWEV